MDEKGPFLAILLIIYFPLFSGGKLLLVKEANVLMTGCVKEALFAAVEDFFEDNFRQFFYRPPKRKIRVTAFKVTV